MRRPLALLLPMMWSLAASAPAHAGVKLANEHGELELGTILQLHTIAGNHDWDQDGTAEGTPRFLVRRARLRLSARIGKVWSAFLQTDRGDGDGRLGAEYRLIDAWMRIRVHPLLQVFAGMHLAPASRQNVTLSTALLALDRPGMVFKSLTWGTRSLGAFANRALPETDAGLRGRTPVRDLGVTLFGATSFDRRVHFKYWLGVYEGVPSEQRVPRVTARVQFNFLDAEPDYFASATYLGKKNTLAIGASYDTQPDVARDAVRGAVRYELVSVDLFAERRWGPGSATLEIGMQNMELGGAAALDADRDRGTPPRNARAAEGRGVYLQAGYHLRGWQPWFGLERWVARDDIGSFHAERVGLTWFFADQLANAKLGFERLVANASLDPDGTRTWYTADLALFVSF